MLETAQLRLMYIQEAIGNGITATRTAFRNSSTLATVRAMLAEAALTVKEKLSAAGRAILTVGQAALTAARNSTILATLRSTAVTVASTVATYAAAAGTAILSGAMFVLGAATSFAMGPLGMIIAALLALGVALFVSLHSPPLYIGMALLATLMIGLGIAMGAITPALMAFGKAMLVVGAGIALAGAGFLMAGLGMRLFGEGIKIAAEGIVLMADSLGVVVDQILRLGFGLVQIGLLGFTAAPGIFLFAIAIGTLTIALLAFAATSFITLPILKVLAFSMLLAGVAAMMLSTAFNNMNPTVLGQTATELERIAAAVNMINTLRMMKLGLAMSLISDSAGAAAPLRAAADLATATAAVTPEAAESTQKMMNAVVNVIQAADAGTGLKFGDQITEILDSVKGIIAAGQGKEGAQKEIKLYMDRNGRKEFAKGIMDELSPELNKRLSISKGPQISG